MILYLITLVIINRPNENASNFPVIFYLGGKRAIIRFVAETVVIGDS